MVLVSLTIASGICALIIGFKIGDWRDFSLFKKFVFVISIIIFAVSGWFFIQEKQEQIKKDEGLKNVNELKSESVLYPRLIVKNTNIIFENRFGAVQLHELDGLTNIELPIPLLNLKVIDNKMFVDFVLRNSHGDPIVTIYKNIWKTYSDDYDYNYDDHALEVITRDHKVILQIEYSGLAALFEGFIGFQMGGGGVYLKNFPTIEVGLYLLVRMVISQNMVKAYPCYSNIQEKCFLK